jgi:hypothetical protein
MAILDPKNLLDLRNWCLEKIVRPFWRFAADCCCVRQEPQVFCATDRVWFISRNGKIGHIAYDSDKLCVVFKAKGQIVSHQESGNYMFFRVANRTSKGWETANPKRGVLFYKGKLIYNGLTTSLSFCADNALINIDNNKGLIVTSGKFLDKDGNESNSCTPFEGLGKGTIQCCAGMFYTAYRKFPPVEEWENYPEIVEYLQWWTVEELLDYIYWYGEDEIASWFNLPYNLIVFGKNNEIIYDDIQYTGQIRYLCSSSSGYAYVVSGDVACLGDSYLRWWRSENELYIAYNGKLVLEASPAMVHSFDRINWVPIFTVFNCATQKAIFYAYDIEVSQYDYAPLAEAAAIYVNDSSITCMTAPLNFTRVTLPMGKTAFYGGNSTNPQSQVPGAFFKIKRQIIYVESRDKIHFLTEDDETNFYGLIRFSDCDEPIRAMDGETPVGTLKYRVFTLNVHGAYTLDLGTLPVTDQTPYFPVFSLPSAEVQTTVNENNQTVYLVPPDGKLLADGSKLRVPTTRNYKLVYPSGDMEYLDSASASVETVFIGRHSFWSPQPCYFGVTSTQTITRTSAVEITTARHGIGGFRDNGMNFGASSAYLVNGGPNCIYFKNSKIEYVLIKQQGPNTSSGVPEYGSTQGSTPHLQLFIQNGGVEEGEELPYYAGSGSTSVSNSLSGSWYFYTPWSVTFNVYYFEDAVYLAAECALINSDSSGLRVNFIMTLPATKGESWWTIGSGETAKTFSAGGILFYQEYPAILPYMPCYRFYLHTPEVTINKLYNQEAGNLPAAYACSGNSYLECGVNACPAGLAVFYRNDVGEYLLVANKSQAVMMEIYYKGKFWKSLSPPLSYSCCGRYLITQESIPPTEEGQVWLDWKEVYYCEETEIKHVTSIGTRQNTESSSFLSTNCCGNIAVCQISSSSKYTWKFINPSGIFTEFSAVNSNGYNNSPYKLLCCNNRSIVATSHISFLVDETFGIVPIDMYDLRVLDETDKNDLEDSDDNRILPLE